MPAWEKDHRDEDAAAASFVAVVISYESLDLMRSGPSIFKKGWGGGVNYHLFPISKGNLAISTLYILGILRFWRRSWLFVFLWYHCALLSHFWRTSLLFFTLYSQFQSVFSFFFFLNHWKAIALKDHPKHQNGYINCIVGYRKRKDTVRTTAIIIDATHINWYWTEIKTQ